VAQDPDQSPIFSLTINESTQKPVMNTYGFTIKSDSGQLYSWIVEAVNRKEAFNKLNQGDRPDSIIILTCRLDEQQKNNWISAAVEHGGFDHQMAQSILNVF
jgi:hypothetical protein